MKMNPQILIVDDDESIRGLIESRLTGFGYQIHAEENAAGLRRALRERSLNTILLDIGLPDGNGIALIKEIHEWEPELPVIIITAHGSIEQAVKAMREGAFDFISKPIDFNRLDVIVKNAVEHDQLKRRVHSLELFRRHQFCDLIGGSPEMQVIYNIIETVAPSRASVLITGESGTGKELAARAIHQLSPRRAEEMIDVNCAAIPKDLLESELFGHEKNAFTGANDQYIGRCERAHNSTLFLDEISEMDSNLQAKLLRFLQELTFQRIGGRESIKVDTRIITATNRDPAEAIRNHQLREDLYYRLNVVNIAMPPLRKRSEDIPSLAEFFLRKYSDENGKAFRTIPDDTMDAMMRARWSGNVRELENTIYQAVVLNEGTVLERSMLPDTVFNGIESPSSPPTHTVRSQNVENHTGNTLEIVPLDALERQAIERALEITQGNVGLAAAKLRVSQATMYRKIRDYNLNLKAIKKENSD